MNNYGIFIKSVVMGGAASRDGRIQSGDQLLAVDGVSLVGISQGQAADIMRNTGSLVTLTIAVQSAQFHGLRHLLSQPSPQTSRVPPPHHVSTPELDTCSTRGSNDNYQNQDWLSTHLPGLTRICEQPTTVPEPGSYYQNLPQFQSRSSPRSPRPMSLHFPSSSVQNFPPQPLQNASSVQSLPFQPMSNSSSIQNIPNTAAAPPPPNLQRREPLILSSNFARVNSGRFRPIHPAPTDVKSEVKDRPPRNQSVIRRGPIRKDGSVVLSPSKPSPALSSTSNSSDKENKGSDFFPNKTANSDDVFVMKDVENANIEVSKVNQVSTLPRVVKKVSFTSNIVHDVSKDDDDGYDASCNSIDDVENPDDFIDEAETIMNLDNLDLNHRTSVVGTQEVYNDPRNKRLQMHQLDLNVNKSDGSSLSFKDKLKLFTNK